MLKYNSFDISFDRVIQSSRYLLGQCLVFLFIFKVKYNILNLLQDDTIKKEGNSNCRWDYSTLSYYAIKIDGQSYSVSIYMDSKMLSKYLMNWWVYESFLLEGENKLGYKWLTATAAPCEKIEI